MANQDWNSWFKYEDLVTFKPKKDILYLPYDSIWFSKLIPPIQDIYIRKAYKMFKKGYCSWKDLWLQNH